MDSSAEANARERIQKLTSACHVKSLGVGTLSSALDLELKARLSETHHWDGATALDGTVPVLAFKLYPDAAFLAKLPDDKLSFYPYGWCLEFGGMLTITACTWPPPEFRYPAPGLFIYSDAEVLKCLEAGRFKAVFYCDTQPVAYCEVNFSDEAGGLTAFRNYIYGVRNHRGDLRDCREALFWAVIESLGIYDEFLRTEDKLSIGWQRDYLHVLRCVSEVRDDLLRDCDFSGYKSADLPKELVEFFDACVPSKFSLNDISAFAVSAYRAMNTFEVYLGCTETINAFAGKSAKLRLAINSLVIELGLRDPDVTASGRRIPWIGLGPTIRFFEPDSTSFPKWFDPEDYWRRLPYKVPYLALGDLTHHQRCQQIFS